MKGQMFPVDGYRMGFKERVAGEASFRTHELGHRSGSFMGVCLGTLLGLRGSSLETNAQKFYGR